MAKYKVNVIKIALKNQKTADYGEIVDGALLTASPETLEKEGYIKKLTAAEAKKENAAEKKAAEEAAEEAAAKEAAEKKAAEEAAKKVVGKQPTEKK